MGFGYSGGTFIVTDEHSLPTMKNPGVPNAVYKYYKDGVHKSSRITNVSGVPTKSIHYTNHGNPKIHPQIPHSHNWGWKNGNWTENSEWY